MGENNSIRSNWQRINLQNIQAAHAAQFQKNKRPNQKIGQRSKQSFLLCISPKKTYRWLTNTWKDVQYHLLSEKCKSKPQWGNHLTPVRMAAIKKSTNSKCWRGCVEKGTLLLCWWKCKLVQPLWRTVWRFLKKLEIELPYDPAIPLLGIHTEETRIEKNTCTLMFITALFTDVHRQTNG